MPPRPFTSSTQACIIACCCFGSTPVVFTPCRPVLPRSSMRKPIFTELGVTPTSLAVNAGADPACCTEPLPLDGAALSLPVAAVLAGPDDAGAGPALTAPAAAVVDVSPAATVVGEPGVDAFAAGAAPAASRDAGPWFSGVP